ncbi:uncharacterized protein LOC101850746 [Aplysia californica]|uniref:Uncharacterized protein LOC101850746 n=1 Tax=Aplysia californica TaxID=6500 RepID=A0ABM0K1F5_APLCA|nr:uncharacterized protein LOC101850746 [Aplysia californica]
MENQGDKTTRKTSLKACSKNAETSPQHLLKAKSRIAYVKSSGLSCSVCASRLCHLPLWNSSWTAHLLRTIPGKQAQRSIVLDFVFKTLFSLVLLLMLVQPGSAEILAYRGGRDAVKSLCEAQCHSWCMDAVGRSCHNCSSSEIPEDVQWMIRCPEENQQQGFSDCQGSCSTFTGQNGE